jgi:uncharacterized protein YqhQ
MARPLYGGQAVLEGVMMRGRRFMAVAARHPQGHIVTRTEPLPTRLYQGRISKTPFLRGIVMLWDALVLGTRAFSFSARVKLADESDAAEPLELPAASAVRMTMLTSLSMGVLLFFVAPMLAAGTLHSQLESATVTNLIEGLVRLAFLMGYLWFIGNAPDIARVFAYHGAEHKVVHAHEQGLDLEPKAVQRCSTAHPRCGTTLLLVVVVLSVLLFALLGHPPLWLRILSRVILIPVLIGVSYEWLRFSATHFQGALVRLLVKPGLLLQSLTTREPDDEQVAVAIAALEAVIAADGAAEEIKVAAPVKIA